MKRYFRVFYIASAKGNVDVYYGRSYFITNDGLYLNEEGAQATILKNNSTLTGLAISNIMELQEADFNELIRTDSSPLIGAPLLMQNERYGNDGKSAEQQYKLPQMGFGGTEDDVQDDDEAARFEAQKKSLDERAERLRKMTLGSAADDSNPRSEK